MSCGFRGARTPCPRAFTTSSRRPCAAGRSPRWQRSTPSAAACGSSASGRPIADVTVDQVVVRAGSAAVRAFDELEVELVDGSERDLRKLTGKLHRAGARPGDQRPRLLRALGLDHPEPPRVDPRARPREQLSAMLRIQYLAILAHDPGTRLGNDPEELHQHRVAVRRLRALLRAAQPMLDRRWVDEPPRRAALAGVSAGRGARSGRAARAPRGRGGRAPGGRRPRLRAHPRRARQPPRGGQGADAGRAARGALHAAAGPARARAGRSAAGGQGDLAAPHRGRGVQAAAQGAATAGRAPGRR